MRVRLRAHGARPDRPDSVFDPMLQHERTALAWERTAVSAMVAGVLFAREAADIDLRWAVVGVMQVVVGAALLIWTGVRYEELHGPLRRGETPARPTTTRLVGVATIVFTGLAVVMGVVGATT